MDNQSTQENIPIEQNPQTPLPVSQNHNKNYLKVIGIGMSIVSFCIAIAVVGYFLGSNKNKTAKVSAPQITSTPTPTPDPTANWKTYTNTDYNFSIKYPDTFKIDDNSANFPPIAIYLRNAAEQQTGEGGGKFNPYFLVQVEPEKMPLDKYLIKYPNLVVKEKKTVNGIDFTIVDVTMGMVTPPLYLTSNNNNIISISNQYLEEKVFDQILSTFRLD